MIARERADAVARALDDWTRADAPRYAALADALHLSRGTVAAAYELLRERGVLERQQVSGT